MVSLFRQGQRSDVIAVLTLCALVCLVYYRIIDGFWTWDDPVLLAHATRTTPWENYLIPSVWRDLNVAFWTPWLPTSLDFDLFLFGMRPKGFYLHHIISLIALALSFYFLLRKWTDPCWALWGSALVVVSAPVMACAYKLMNRHYIEGMVFALLSITIHVAALRSGKWRWVPLSTLLFFAACVSKEVFLPIALLALLLPGGNGKQRLFMAMPMSVFAAVYIFWRRCMIGAWLGSYGTLPGFDWILDALRSFPGRLLGSGVSGWTLGIVLLLILATTAIRWRSSRMLIPVVSILTLVPPLFAVEWVGYEPRFLLVPWCTLAFVTAILIGSLWNAGGRIRILALLLSIQVTIPTVIHTSRLYRTETFPGNIRFEVQGRYLFSGVSDELLWTEIDLRYAHTLTWLRAYHGLGVAPLLACDESEIKSAPPNISRVWRYDSSCYCLRDISDEIPDTLERWEVQVVETPLSVRLEQENHMIRWEFGPYIKGSYTVIEHQQWGRLWLPPSGSGRIQIIEPVQFVVRYDSPDGWITYSDELRFQGRDGEVLEWSR